MSTIACTGVFRPIGAMADLGRRNACRVLGGRCARVRHREMEMYRRSPKGCLGRDEAVFVQWLCFLRTKS